MKKENQREKEGEGKREETEVEGGHWRAAEASKALPSSEKGKKRERRGMGENGRKGRGRLPNGQNRSHGIREIEKEIDDPPLFHS